MAGRSEPHRGQVKGSTSQTFLISSFHVLGSARYPMFPLNSVPGLCRSYGLFRRLHGHAADRRDNLRDMAYAHAKASYLFLTLKILKVGTN